MAWPTRRGTAPLVLHTFEDPKRLPENKMQPNVLVIVSDTLRWDALGVNGGPGWLQIKTDELDKFARESVCFDNARVSSFPTIPMRTDCFTGTFGHPRYGWQPIRSDILTLPKIFASKGYTTQLLADTTHLLRADFWRHFSHFHFLRGQEGDQYVSRTNRRPQRIVSDLSKTRVEYGRAGDEPTISEIHTHTNAWWRYESDRFSSRLADRTCQWLEDNWRGPPFLLWVDFFDVHEPWDPPEYLWRMYQPVYDGEPMIQPNYHSADAYTPEELANLRARYAGEVTLVSKNIGRIIRLMRDMDILDRTIVVLLSDHGIYLGERGRTGKSLITPESFDAFPQHTELSHLVWMMRIPGSEPKHVDGLVQPPDLLPTLLELCDIPVPSGTEGISLLPLIDGEPLRQQRLAISAWTMHTHHSRELVYCRRPAVTDGEWTLVLQEPPDPQPPKLFHVSEDPKEHVDLMREEQQEARRLHSEMLEWLAGKGAPASALDRLRKAIPA